MSEKGEWGNISELKNCLVDSWISPIYSLDKLLSTCGSITYLYRLVVHVLRKPPLSVVLFRFLFIMLNLRIHLQVLFHFHFVNYFILILGSVVYRTEKQLFKSFDTKNLVHLAWFRVFFYSSVSLSSSLNLFLNQ